MPSRNSRPEKLPSAKIEPARAVGEEGYLYRFEDLKGLELLSADYQNHAFLPHWHNALTVSAVVRGGDVVVAAAGRAGMITGEMVKPGAAVVDVGINRVDGRVVGDVAEDVREVAGLLTPVPGGVGPMTIAMLLRNTVTAARLQAGALAFPGR